MASTDTQPLDRGVLRQMYQLIAEEEGVGRGTILDTGVEVETDDIEEYIDSLTDAGYLEERDGELQIGIPVDAEDVIGDRDHTIRIARRDDLPEIKEIIREVTAERTYVEAETVAEELDRDETLVRFDDEITRIFFVAEHDGNVVGWLHIESPNREKLKHTAQFTVGVGEDHRGMGIGQDLMTLGLEWARAHGYRKVYNDFPATNRGALAFLDALEYDAHCEAVHRDHYLIDDDFVDQMTLAVYLEGSPATLTHFDRVQMEAEEIYE